MKITNTFVQKAGSILSTVAMLSMILGPLATPVTAMATTVVNKKVIFITAGTHWTVPADWNSADNTIEVIGAGGGGGGADDHNGDEGAGGGGGAYAKISNLSLTAGSSVKYQVGVGGQGDSGKKNGDNGTDTFFNQTTGDGTGCNSGNISVCAKGGDGGHGNGGDAGNGGDGSGKSVGDTKYSGGKGAEKHSGSSGGGGGAAGPSGAGKNASHASGGDGDNSNGGSGGTSGSAGGDGAEWTATNVWNGTSYTGATPSGGSGGGGGGLNSSGGNGGDGGDYGAGGAGGDVNGGDGGDGANGLIVITYTPIATTGTLHVVKIVSGSDASPSDFSFSVDGGDSTAFDGSGTNDIVVNAGTHTVIESSAENYTTDYDNCEDVNVPAGGEATCTITNTYHAPEEPTTGTIEITKYACPDGTSVVRSVNGVGGTVPEGCTPESGVHFGYVHGEQTDANAPYPELDAELSAGGTTNGSGILNITNLPSDGRYLIEETNADNQRLPDNEVLGLYCQGDGDTSDNNDNQELTFVPAGGVTKCVAYDAAPPTPKSCTVVSDSSTLQNGGSAVELAYTAVTSVWTHALDGIAKWIWGEDPIDPATDKVETFTKTFGLTDAPSAASLTLAADNGFTVNVNGTDVDTSEANTEHNYEALHAPYDIASLLHAGNNTITLTVKNIGAGSESNPAGVVFKADIEGSNCTDVTPPNETSTVKVHILKYLTNGEGISPVAGDSGAPAFPMWAQWTAENLNNGAQTSGNYVLGPSGWGGSGPYAADTSPMNVGASYETYEVQDGTVVLPPLNEENPESNMACSPGKYRFVGYKTGDSLQGALDADTTLTIPTFFPLSADKYVIVVNEKCPDTSTVTICKYDNNKNSLSGWNVFLKGDFVESLDVPTNTSGGINTSNSLTAGVSYLATALGTWTNRTRAKVENPADAEYSTEDNWSTHMDGYDGYGTGILELEINQNDGNWGPYNSSHEYAQSFTQGSDGSANFRIFDGDTGSHTQNEGWFGDNSGSLAVGIFKGYAGTTGDNGCVTFENVPYGTYTLGETPQDGWTNVSGNGDEVTVDSATKEFDIVNQESSGQEQEQTVDMCTNMEGDQATVPAGYHRIYDGRCIKNGGGSTTETFTSGGGGGSVLGESTTTEPTAEPQVLGEACGLYMDKFLRFGHTDNDAGQTMKLQTFLNKWINANLPVTGFFGPLTDAAVKKFQNKYSDEILKPWNIPGPTGLVYLTTLREINLLECPELSLEVPPLVVWSSNPSTH